MGRKQKKSEPGKPPSAGHILIIEDDETIRQMLEVVFKRYHFQTNIAKDGKEGVDFFLKNADSVHLIVMDWKMPVMDGKMALQRIRAIKPDQKVLLISGYIDPEDLSKILNPYTRYLPKPFTISKVIEEVEVLLK